MDDPFARLAELAKNLSRTGDLQDAERAAAEAKNVQEAVTQRLAEPGTATDPSGMVEATVRSDGTVDALYIPARALRDLDDEALGAACADAVRTARGNAATAAVSWLGGGTDDERR